MFYGLRNRKRIVMKRMLKNVVLTACVIILCSAPSFADVQGSALGAAANQAIMKVKAQVATQRLNWNALEEAKKKEEADRQKFIDEQAEAAAEEERQAEIEKQREAEAKAVEMSERQAAEVEAAAKAKEEAEAKARAEEEAKAKAEAEAKAKAEEEAAKAKEAEEAQNKSAAQSEQQNNSEVSSQSDGTAQSQNSQPAPADTAPSAPAPDATNTLLNIARSQIGITTGSKYWGYYVGTTFISSSSTPWCGCFVAWCFNEAGITGKIGQVPNKAYVPSYRDWGRSTGKLTYTPSPGDIVLFGGSGGSHIGIVESVSGDYISTIEGNTGGSYYGAVKRNRHRISGSWVHSFIHWQ